MQATKENSVSQKVYLGPCALIFSSAETGTWRVVRPSINTEVCIYCGICEKHCPGDVMTVTKDKSSGKGKPTGKVEIDFSYCKGCGICANVCPKGSISMIDEREV
jgi:2-oxoacid:acceptor oxidoreductase delta subunit (pyruvate/2-ketoisovalerate family)